MKWRRGLCAHPQWKSNSGGKRKAEVGLGWSISKKASRNRENKRDKKYNMVLAASYIITHNLIKAGVKFVQCVRGA